MFAFYMTTPGQKKESDITFGYYDKTKYKGNLEWHPVLFKYLFGIRLDDVKLNGKSLGFCGPAGQNPNCLLAIDTGTSTISMP